MNVTINSSGSSVNVVFDSPVTYSSGQVDLTGGQRLGLTSSIASSLGIDLNRKFSTVGAPTSGDGTANHTYDIEDGFVVFEGEPITSDININAGFGSLAAANNADGGTNTECDGSPEVRISLSEDFFNEGDSLTVYADATGHLGALDGLSGVNLTVTDGLNTEGGTATLTSVTGPNGQTRRLWARTLDMTAVDRGTVTFEAEATSNAGLGSRTVTVSTLNYAGTGGTDPGIITYYIDGTSGNNSNSGTTIGAPLLNIGGAVNKARFTSNSAAIFRFITAGTYFPRAGDAGVSYSGKIKMQADVDGVVLKSSGSLINVRVTGGIWITSQDSSSYKFKVLLLDDLLTNTLASVGNPIYSDEGTLFTHDTLTAAQNSGVAYALRNDTRFFSWGSTINNILAFGANANATTASGLGNETEAWFTEISDLVADPFNNFTTIVGCKCTALGKGLEAFTVAYSGAGAATIAREGVAADQSGTHDLVLSVDAIEVLRLDLQNASYDTLTEVVATIDALTDWAAVLIDTNLTYAADEIWPFAETEVTSFALSVYYRNTFHSDGYQIFGQSGMSPKRRVYIGGYELTRADRIGEGSGTIGDQTWWFDHAGPIDLEGVIIREFTDWQGLNAQGVVPSPRSGFHGVIKNAVVMLNTLPSTKIGLVYPGSGSTPGSQFDPTNFTICHNVAYVITNEDASSGGPVPKPSDIDVFNNHWQTNTEFEAFSGDGDTTGAILPLLRGSWTTPESANPNPVGVALQNRLAMPSVTDYQGNQRGETDSVGASRYTDDAMTNPNLTTTQPQAALDTIKTDCDTLNTVGVGTSTITASDLTNPANTTAGEIAVQKTNQDNLNVDNTLGLTLTVPIGDFVDQFQTLYDNNVAIEAVI